MEVKTLSLAKASPPVDICYAEWLPPGDSKGTVVCVHGLSRQKHDFDYLARYLAAEGYRVLSVDAPGRGGSSRFDDPDLYRPEIYAQVFENFLETLNLQKVHWIGTSMGGLIALSMAEQGGAARFASLTLVDITHQPNVDACRRIAGYMTENLPVIQDVEGYIALLKVNLPLGEVSYDVWRHYAMQQLVADDNGGYRFHFDPAIVPRARKDLSAPIDLTAGLVALASCPLSLVAGGKSDLCTGAEITALQERRPDFSLHICQDAGHVPALSDLATQQFICHFLEATGQKPSFSPKPDFDRRP